MAYTTPTVDDFLTRFEPLSDTADSVVSQAIAEAARYVDDSWREADYADAILYLAAHWITREKSAEQSGDVVSESFGPISVTYAQGQRDTSSGSIGTTHYGQQFERLRRGNFPAIVVI